MGIGDWGLGIGVWGFVGGGREPNAQPRTPNKKHDGKKKF